MGIVTTVVAALLAAGSAATHELLARRREHADFERLKEDLFAVRSRTRAHGVITRVCGAATCARAIALGAPPGSVLVEDVAECGPATVPIAGTARFLRYDARATALPSGSADGVCFHPDGVITGHAGLPLDTLVDFGFTYTDARGRVSRLIFDVLDGRLVRVDGPHGPVRDDDESERGRP